MKTGIWGCKGLCAVLAASMMLTGCSLFPKEEAEEIPVLVKPAEITYQTQDVERGVVEDIMQDTATIKSAKEYSLTFDSRGGYLGRWEIRAGDKVKKGQTIGALDVDSLQSDIRRQEINVERTQIRYDKVKRTSEDKDDLRLAQLDLDEQKLILKELKNEYGKSTLVSPIDGVVTYVSNVKVGDHVSARQVLAVVADTQKLHVQYSGSKKNALSIGQEVQITVNGTKETGSGKVVMTPAKAIENGSKDETEREAALIRADEMDLGKAGIGSGVVVRVTLDKRDDVIWVPSSAVEATPTSGSVVYVLEDGLKTERVVEVGLVTTTRTEIISGLEEGEKLVVK